ncbi:SMC-Scp complex subunit ScpB [Halofilum ochraceum]|uniref:SMC-Scp complex subunit ScpB n=1 Tax=Halofilum ochraceum TaxID=1611323 RepID=UPI0008D99527
MAIEDHEPDPGTEGADDASADHGDGPVDDGPERDPDRATVDSRADVGDDAPGESADEAVTDEPTAEAVNEGSADAAATGDGYATESIKRILEAALLVAGRPLAITDFEKLFGGSTEAPPRNAIRGALAELATDWSGRSLTLQEVASGWRAQVRAEFEPWIARLWDEKPPRYSRALLETLAIIAYRQPMTRSEIEDIRGVSVSSQIIRTLSEREWIRVVGHREAPGRPAMYGTTREFLDYFNLKTLDQLPPISDIKDLEGQYPELGFEAEPASGAGASGEGAVAAPDDGAASPQGHDVDDGHTAETPEGERTGASADGDDTNTGSEDGDDFPDDAPAAEEAPADMDTPSSTDDDDPDQDDAEESPCTPAS